MKRFDVIVVGTGALGSAALYHLARRGRAVLGIDRFAPPHDRGSSHGHTRIYRQAYYEAPDYVPLARRALELWRELERDGEARLFSQTGALTIGSERGVLFTGALRSAQAHGIEHEVLNEADVARRFPAFRSPPGAAALFEPTGGVLFPDACIRAHLELSGKHGAVLRTNEIVERIEPRGNATVAVTTSRGRYEAARVVVAAGAWTPGLIGAERAFTVTRETVYWFRGTPVSSFSGSCPVAMIDYEDGPILYTIPDFGDGFKAALHHAGPVADPDAPPGPDGDTGAARVASLVARYAPGGAGLLLAHAPCFYTNTADGHFAIGPLPSAPSIILASACSGHGFKFASALGEGVARLALGGDSGLPAALFDVARL